MFSILARHAAEQVNACTLTLRLSPADSLPTLRVDLPTREVRKVTADKC